MATGSSEKYQNKLNHTDLLVKDYKRRLGTGDIFVGFGSLHSFSSKTLDKMRKKKTTTTVTLCGQRREDYDVLTVLHR